MSDLRNFLRKLWFSVSNAIPPDGLFTLWANGQSIHLPIQDETFFDDLIGCVDGYEDDLYFGVGLRHPSLRGSHRQGSEETILAVPGVWLDIDIASDVHKKTDLPPTLEAVGELLDEFGLPPSLVVHSGYGIHAYHVFESPLLLPGRQEQANFKALLNGFQAAFRALLIRRGWSLDHTAKIQQILRLPQTKNYKKDPPAEVALILDDGPFYSVERIRSVSSSLSKTQHLSPHPDSNPGPNPSQVDGDSSFRGSDWRVNLRERLLRLRNAENRDLILKIIQGQPFAKPGERNSLCNRAVGVVAYVAFRVKPDVEASELYEMFRSSIERMASMDFDQRNPPLTEDVVLDQLRRSLEDIRQRTQEEHDRDERIAKRLIELSTVRRSHSIMTGNGNGHAEHSVLPAQLTDEEIRKARRLSIIMYRGAFYVMSNGRYRRPVTERELMVALRNDLELEEGYSLRYMDDKGNLKLKTFQMILMEYATVARRLVYDLTISDSYYDPESETFYEAIAPLRKLTPKYNENIDQWLKLLAGKYYERLADWLMTVIDLSQQTCALYLHGPKGAGKTMLVQGLARLWRESGGPTNFSNAFSSFNADIGECPLVLADEHITADRKSISSEIRAFIGTSERCVNRKFLPTAPLIGAARLVLLANNQKLFYSLGNEDLDEMDVDAIVSRFFYIPVSGDASSFLEAHGGHLMTKGWVTGDLIAKHVLWLRQTRLEQFKPGHRFLVEGERSMVHDFLVTQGSAASTMIELLAKCLMNPKDILLTSGAVTFSKGRFLVTASIIDEWDHYIHKAHKPPTLQRAGKILRSLSWETFYLGKKKYWVIKHEMIFAWAQESHFGDMDVMKKRLGLDGEVQVH